MTWAIQEAFTVSFLSQTLPQLKYETSNKNILLQLAVLAVLGALVFASLSNGLAQSGINENGLIASDAVWTKAGSPYSLTGPVAINEGVTLTVEPGATIT